MKSQGEGRKCHGIQGLHISCVCRHQELIPINMKLKYFTLEPVLVVAFKLIRQFNISVENAHKISVDGLHQIEIAETALEATVCHVHLVLILRLLMRDARRAALAVATHMETVDVRLQ